MKGSTVLIGREEERCRLCDLMRQRKNIVVLGEEGVGKSAIIENVLAGGEIRRLLYSKHSTTLKETLINMIESAIGGKDLQKKNILSLKKICYQLLRERSEYAVLDHVAWVEPKFYGFLIYLLERKLPFVIVTRRPGKENVGHLWMGLYDFEKLEIKNLDQPKADQLIEYYASSFCLKIDATADFKKGVFNISRGNPKIIRQLCWLAQDEKYRAKGYIDVRLMDLDRRIKSAII
jgi:integrase/recombinase XerD